MHESIHVCMHVCRHTYMNLYVCMYRLMDVGRHVCTFVYICMYGWMDMGRTAWMHVKRVWSFWIICIIVCVQDTSHQFASNGEKTNNEAFPFYFIW